VVGTLAAPAIDREPGVSARRTRGFSLVDVLVTLAVISVLIGLLLPTLSGVRETTRQVVCRSNVRQLGYGIVLFADDRNDQIPFSFFAMSDQPHLTTLIRRESPTPWDGLGHLYENDYLPTPGVFYCPSHTGSHPLSKYVDRWPLNANETPTNEFDIVVNYQYRGTVSGMTHLSRIRNPRAALIADALQTRDDFNHRVGTNLLRADLSANWFSDPGGRIADQLPNDAATPDAAQKVNDVWDQLDQPNDGGN
jgi:competence protein ComGC